MKNHFLIAETSETTRIEARSDGLWLVYEGDNPNVALSRSADWHIDGTCSPLGKSVANCVQQLVEQELGETRGQDVVVPYANFSTIDDLEYTFLSDLAPWAPFSLSIEATGSLGLPKFGYRVAFLLGSQQAFVERVGAFVRRNTQVYRLSPATYQILDQIEYFQNLAEVDQTKEQGLKVLSSIKELGRISGTEFDEYLTKEEVLVPSRVRVNIVSHEDDRISLAPAFEGVSEDAMRDAFLALDDVQTVYDLPKPNGGRIRVVLEPDMKEVLRDLRLARRVGGNDRERIIADIDSVFSDGTSRELIDLADFGPRVRAIGDVPARAKVAAKKKSNGWDDANILEPEDLDFTIRCSQDGVELEIPIESKEELEELSELVGNAQAQGKIAITFKGHRLIIDEGLVGSIKESQLLVGLCKKPKNSNDKRGQAKLAYRYLLIYTNEDEVDFSEGDTSQVFEAAPTYFTRPKALKSTFFDRSGNERSVDIKTHQIEGIQWLKYLFENRLYRRGALLADDMGLGKTLQILTFLAWAIEEGYVEGLGSDTPPWQPILIVAPVILLENWEEELRRFFDDSVFSPAQIIHGKTLRKLVTRKDRGKELELGVPKLDIDALREHRVVITNYDTVLNYQHSFARVDWSIVVCDEAQEIKEHTAKKSEALKALKAVFRVVSTGTPVENRLLDLWNLMDFIQPGTLFGSGREFSNYYEFDPDDTPEEEQRRLTEELRDALQFGKPHSFVKRRQKEDVLEDLPDKHEVTVRCDLSTTQRNMHLGLVRRIKHEDSKTHHFSLLHSLRKLYMHPRLETGYGSVDSPSTFVSECSKLKATIDILNKAKRKSEKALIFTESIPMQQILAQVVGAEFGLDVDIINGSPNSREQKKYSIQNRKQLIEAFEAKEGFNVIVLSPHVAGVGLTITGANHVIHYSRWWNPAKEAQATDRAYRIGQEKDVYVYYLIATDPKGEFESFDEKLDKLLNFKKGLARDFLLPIGGDEGTQDDLLKSFRNDEVVDEQDSDAGETVKTLSEVAALSHQRFEALIACIFERAGNDVLLTPKTNDRGLDVIAINDREVLLIQAKHSGSATVIEPDVLSELEEGLDFYRSNFFSESLKRKQLRRLAVTNSRFASSTRQQAKTKEIELLDGKSLLKRLKKCSVSHVEVIDMDMKRLNSLDKVQTTLSQWTS